MNLFIPEIGTKLKLPEDWNFTLFNEYRNREMFTDKMNEEIERAREALDKEIIFWENKVQEEINTGKFDWNTAPSSAKHDCARNKRYGFNSQVNFNFPLSLPKNTTLLVDRIYIRKGNSAYSSITFRIPKEKGIKSKRFWVKLDDANKIKCEVVEKLENKL